MAGNQPPEGYATDDFLEQILAIPSYSTLPPVNEVGGGGGGSSSDTASLTSAVSQLSSAGGGGALHHQSQLFPLGLSLDNGRDDVSDTGAAFGLKPVSFFFFIYIILSTFSRCSSHRWNFSRYLSGNWRVILNFSPFSLCRIGNQ